MSSNIPNTLLNKKKSIINVEERRCLKSVSTRNYIKPFIPPCGLTAYSYIVMETNSQVHISWNSKTMVEIASLTKIMTCVCLLRIIDDYHLDFDQQVEIGIVETSIIGTSAKLRKGQRYTVRQLLYGMMLPSGNDASLALAVWAGRALNRNGWRGCAPSELRKRESISLFVDYMNSMAVEL